MTAIKIASTAAVVATALSVMSAVPATASGTPTKYFSSCAKLNKQYGAGVAKNAAAARRAVRNGYSRPSTTKAAKTTYWDNYTRLDRDRDGTACES